MSKTPRTTQRASFSPTNEAVRTDGHANPPPNAPVYSGLDEFALLRAHIETFNRDHPELAVYDSESVRRGGDVTAPVTTSPAKRGRPRKERPMDPVHPVAPNAPTFDSLLAVATELGTQAGQGQDVQIKFDLKIIEAAYLGAVNLDPNKHGKDRRDGIVLAEAYTKARKGAIIFDAKSDANRKLISNVDKCIKLGSNPKWGGGQPLQTVNELVTHRQTLRKDPANAKKLEDAHNMVMRYATQQLKRDTLIDGDELKAFALKKDHPTRTVEDVLEAIRKTANNLKVGKISNCTELDNSPEVQAIINAVTKRLTAIAKARGAAQNAPGAPASA